MAIELTDDGTLDTVLRCSDCGEEMRYNYDPEASTDCPVCGADERSGCMCALDNPTWETARMKQYDAFIDWAIEDATADHECPVDAEPTEPQEDDITTTDHETFYQNGKRVVERGVSDQWYYAIPGNGPLMKLGKFQTVDAALRAYMDRTQFWPNVWFISDHGNAHLMTLTEGK